MHRWDESEQRVGWMEVKGRWRRRRGIEESVGADNSRRRGARTGDERARDGGNRGGIEGGGGWKR